MLCPFVIRFRMKKVLNVYSGTDINICVPSHPLSQAMAIKRMVDRIIASEEKEFEVNVNSMEGVTFIEKLSKKHGIKIKYYINGQSSSYDEVLNDLNRGWEYLNNN